MARPHALKVDLSPREAAILGRIARSRKSAASLVERARLVLLASEGMKTKDIAVELGVDRQRVRRWRNRWARVLAARVREVELVADDSVLAVAIEEALSDRHRTGPPPKFTPEQEEQVRAMANMDLADGKLISPTIEEPAPTSSSLPTFSEPSPLTQVPAGCSSSTTSTRTSRPSWSNGSQAPAASSRTWARSSSEDTCETEHRAPSS
ncbi:MAG: helix-turn-helix domain-containing protein [Prochlorococcus sp.]|nr:helix-turn-helix domain-containing protein [Prochlorococcus sp.]